MYELIILSILMMGGPFHGYLMAKIINDVIGPFAKASTGRIYPLLSQLEAGGLVVGAEETVGGRVHRVFRITDVGRKRFRQLMLDTASNPKGYQELFRYKVTAMQYLEPEERLYLFDHYISYCQAHIMHLTGEVKEYYQHPEYYTAWSPAQVESFLGVMRHVIRTWELEAEWAREMRAKVAEDEPEQEVGPCRT
ncbi:MAG TPA: PadR family transcriptional regulator [Symbiobacteriaceae bacterium]|nr:PadR family transcriptional regulator [Symbiobacteriaceae bacterium]